ncbi:hypothetical protein [Apilactobacillus kunkeei]|uniref:Uncharacterized protein n=1 Tax=Apilactobacillus kunkeei TaxID=148814 RepID=A0A0P7KAI4_9LACO|nr:hypothetical protein [Apilactobacillus kunkeei]KPN84138.1 hypothetical protein RZ78_04210 [Apilactobacillus kunkeei]
MKESNDNNLKVSRYWKKALYSSILLGAIFIGGQYVESVQTKADTVSDTQSSSQSDQVSILFVNAEDHSEAIPDFVNGNIGKPINLVYYKTKLQDLGYDVSNISDTYTPTTQENAQNPDANTFYVNLTGAEQEPNDLNGSNKLIFEIKDQNYNYIESKYSSTDSNKYDFNTSNNPDYQKIMNDLNQEQTKYKLNIVSNGAPMTYDSTINTNIGAPTELHKGDNVFYIFVVAPTHALTINYVNQNNVTVFKTIRQVTNYGHTNFYDDASKFNDNGISINPGQQYVSNNQDTATINVTTDSTFVAPTNPSDVKTYDYGYASPDVSDASQTIPSDGYYTTVNVVGADGNNIVSLLVGSSESQLVSTNNLGPENQDYTSLVNFNNVKDLPSFIDLTKGPYTFHSTDTLSGLQASSAAAKSQAAAEQQASSSAQSSQSNQPQQAAPQSSASQPAVESAKSSAVVSSASQPSIEPAKSSAQPSSVPAEQPAAPAVQSHSTASPVVSTAKSTPAPETKKTPAPAPKPVVKPAPQTAKPVVKAKTENAKPTKEQLKTITKTYKQSEHAVKTDTAKLKSLKKKMKKHATKEQKTTYKKLQTKLAIEKKVLKSVKVKEEKVTKYFKSVSTINHDSKQIKSLTAQLKKLKKNHSKANKKKAAKVQKALKKANNSLKAATKFVKKYK